MYIYQADVGGLKNMTNIKQCSRPNKGTFSLPRSQTKEINLKIKNFQVIIIKYLFS